MSVTHDFLVGFSKSFGLFYLIALSVAVLIYAYWPSNKSRFDHAARSILSDEDKPYEGTLYGDTAHKDTAYGDKPWR
jgi:cytochrome c oxidase cbb3-type subunit 4